MRRFLKVDVRILVAFFLLGGSQARGQAYFPEIGPDAIHQRALDLRSGLNVLSISIEPGFEDFPVLAQLRMSSGATVLSAYLSNGEGGESDHIAEYPPRLAARRREEATNAMSRLEADTYFLNMPYIAAARDTNDVRNSWHPDTLQLRLAKLLSEFKPDVIILARDLMVVNEESPRLKILEADLLATVRKLPLRNGFPFSFDRWQVDRVVVEVGSGGLSIDVDEKHPKWKKSYREIGEEVAGEYSSLLHQRTLWNNRRSQAYRQVYTSKAGKLQTLVGGLPVRSASHVRRIDGEIQRLCAAVMKGEKRVAVKGSKGVLSNVASLLDTVDTYLRNVGDPNLKSRKLFLRWKGGLENLRNALLGAQVKYSLSETILTDLQLTLLRIDSVSGSSDEGVTSVFFPAVNDGWIVNESWERNLPLAKENYRLLSPSKLQYDYPHAEFGLDKSRVGTPFTFFVIHRGPTRETSFVYRAVTRIYFTPRFTTEIMTPIVRVVPHERVVVKLTNHSRDGVRDVVHIDDTLAVSTKSEFRLNEKEAYHLDTLLLTWKADISEGTYLVPVMINNVEVSSFAARKFEAAVDNTKRVGVIAGVESSPALEALRRLGLGYLELDPQSALPGGLDVVLVDRRAMSLRKGMESIARHLLEFASDGGHLIVLAQDAEVWNQAPLWRGMTLSSTFSLHAMTSLTLAQDHPIVSSPNVITNDDFDFWLFRRGYNTLILDQPGAFAAPITVTVGGDPLVVSTPLGRGKATYVDLALHPQWMNIHAGAFRLLANLIAY